MIARLRSTHFFLIAMGSSSELEYQLILAHDLEYLVGKVYFELSSELLEIRRMLNSYIQKLKSIFAKKYFYLHVLNKRPIP